MDHRLSDGDKCPRCGAPEVESQTPRTVYACGSSDYDGRPESIVVRCGAIALPTSEELTAEVMDHGLMDVGRVVEFERSPPTLIYVLPKPVCVPLARRARYGGRKGRRAARRLRMLSRELERLQREYSTPSVTITSVNHADGYIFATACET